MSKKEDNPLLNFVEPYILQAKRKWRHRETITIPGLNKAVDKIQIPLINKTIYVENRIPGLIEDTFTNLGFVTKIDELRPELKAKRMTDYGWHLVYELPPGISRRDIITKKHYFEDATKSHIEMDWKGGYLHIDIQTESLPTLVKYEWNPSEYLDTMDLPIPLGMTHKGLLVIDLANSESPHMLVAGATGGGKSNFVLMLLHSLLMLQDRVNPYVIDRKKVDFEYIKEYVTVVEEEEDALNLLKHLWEEHEKRLKKLKKKTVKKIQDYNKVSKEKMKYLVCIIDEFAAIADESSHKLVDQFARLARATGIILIAATQKPSSKKMDTDTRSQFGLRISFPLESEVDSRMVLGENNPEAAWLERVKGRCIYKAGLELTEVQTLLLTDKKAFQLLKGLDKREDDGIARSKTKPPKERLKPR